MLDRKLQQDNTLYMVTLPSGEMRYIGESCMALFQPSTPPTINTSWQTLIPDQLHSDVNNSLKKVLKQHATSPIKLTFEVAGELREDELHLEPLVDSNNTLIAISWYGSKQTLLNNHYREIFYRSAIAQWVMDPRPIHQYLLASGIDTPVAIEERAKSDSTFLSNLRELFSILDANATAIKLFGANSIKAFKQGFISNATEDEVLNTCFAILGINKDSERHIYQTDIETLDKEKKSLWISCETPSIHDMGQGMFMSALDISQMKNAELELEEREQFLGTILKTVPDILMVFDATRKEPIFQNIDITKVLGYTTQDVEDTKDHLLQYITHPDDSITKESLTEMYRVLGSGNIYETTIRLQHNNGDWHHFYFRSAALDIDEKGNVLTAVIVARDITEVLKAQQILSEQQRHYQLLAENFSDVIITTDTLFRINYVSPSIEETLGYHTQDFIKKRDAIATLGLTEHAERLARTLADTVLRVETQSEDFNEIVESEAIKADGSIVPVELTLSIVRDEHHLLEGMLIIVRDITERRKIEADQRLAAKVFENSMEGVYITNATGHIVQVNNAFIEITGHKVEDVIGHKPSDLGSGWRDKNFAKDIKPQLESEGCWSGELMSRRSNGEAFLVWMSMSKVVDSRGELLGVITSFRDITEAKTSEESIRKLAYYDPLTELPNRSLFHDRLLQALQRANRNRRYIAILFMDLDGFKAVNDSLGHAQGDHLLTEAASRLKECIRSDDTVARMGGDEFTIILNALTDREAAENAAAQVASKIIDIINKPFMLQDKEVRIGVSIGISLYPDDAINEDELIKLADTAMYHAKQAGKNGYQFYTDDMHQRAEQRQEIEQDLHKAIDNDEFVLAFQPKLIAKSQELYGFEALMRWEHPTKGLIPPSGFMRSLDELGLGTKIGNWVINKACEQLKIWIDDKQTNCSISVNVFARQYRDGELVSTVDHALKKTGISPELLTIEISESLIMKDLGFSFSIISDLKSLGVNVSVDDFATGVMSLQYLNRLPIDEVKIDRQFIQHMDTEANQHRLVCAMIGIANNMGIDVVAEGVERNEQLKMLLDAGCSKVQGFLFCKPLLDCDLKAYIASTENISASKALH